MKLLFIDISSATSLIEVVDNNSNHSPTSLEETYRITTPLHNKESSGTLSGKVNQIVPSLIDPTKGLVDGECVAFNIKASSGTNKITIARNKNSLFVSVISNSGTVSQVFFSVSKKIFKHNKFGEYADASRTILIVAVNTFSNLFFSPGKNEEISFKKLIKKILVIRIVSVLNNYGRLNQKN